MKPIEQPESFLMRDQKVSCSLNRLAVGVERASSHSLPSLDPIDHHPVVQSGTKAEAGSYFVEGGKFNVMGSQYESSLFSSSLSELFSRKCKFSPQCFFNKNLYINWCKLIFDL